MCLSSLISAMIVQVAGRFVTLRVTLLIGVALEGCLLLAMGTILPMAHFRYRFSYHKISLQLFRETWITYSFIGITASFIILLPFVFVSSATLMSEFTDQSQKSTIQGNNFPSILVSKFQDSELPPKDWPKFAAQFGELALFLSTCCVSII